MNQGIQRRCGKEGCEAASGCSRGTGRFVHGKRRYEERGHGEKADVGIDRVKEIAVGHAGVKSSDVVFSKAKLERDDDDDNDEDD